MKNQLNVEALGDREIVMTRAFDAPRQMVWDAYTRPELLRRWLGVRGGWTFAECEVDLRVGGAYRWVWRGPDGQLMGMGGVFREVSPPARLVATEKFDDPWYPGESVNTVTFVEEGGKTVMTTTMRYESRAARDGVLASPMEKGVAESYAMLDEVLTGR